MPPVKVFKNILQTANLSDENARSHHSVVGIYSPRQRHWVPCNGVGTQAPYYSVLLPRTTRAYFITSSVTLLSRCMWS